MPGSAFDSNVLLYLVSVNDQRAARARDLVADGGTISVQTLNEVVNVGRRKFKMPWPDLDALLDELKDLLSLVPVDLETHETACGLARRYKIAFYDAAIVAAALLADCDTLWSEDMHDGLFIDGRLTIRNPFAA
ncbi:PIN domain-containing protein [Sphingomonas sp. 10B4]|uniref:PIN domain-containing protein n=1 Tax=Sphingomonas sp. 10B4 TaxID=3048575 RepID=UPI002AB4CD20|nr:PIN domain-containing protein [Sphingomonas sp. 10B4]MDY7524661.1 PIN domain-containing protein [Sphingomonas sp. 10B4]MEB0284203.1 PIN domain-containing protein [Sphingomonas sp. 10B4]